MNTVRVKIIRGATGGAGPQAGAVVAVSPVEAHRLLHTGSAELVDTASRASVWRQALAQWGTVVHRSDRRPGN